MTEEQRAWTACVAQGVWMSTEGQWTETKEIEMGKVGHAGLDLSGNTRKSGDGQRVVGKRWTRRNMATHFVVI